MNTGRGGIWSTRIDFEDLEVATEHAAAARRVLLGAGGHDLLDMVGV